MRYTMMLAALLLSLTSIVGQNKPLEFEVASVKLNKSSNGYRLGCYSPKSKSNVVPRGMCEIVGAPLRVIIGEAYGVDFFRVSDLVVGIPSGLAGDGYDIKGKAENPSATSEELHAMLRNLLAERFKLRVHEELKEQSGYALIFGKNDPKLARATDDKRHSIGAFGTAPTQLEGINSSMAELAEYFSRQFHRPFSDETGLQGRYDFKLTFVFDAPSFANVQPLRPEARLVIPLNDSALPAVSSALQGQLGLKLEAKKIPIRMVVIDHAEKPDAN